MDNKNGQVTGSHVRLVTTDNVEHEHHEQVSIMHPQRIVWWLAGFLVIQSLLLFLHSSANRQELNENAKLIKQLQERIIVKGMIKKR